MVRIQDDLMNDTVETQATFQEEAAESNDSAVAGAESMAVPDDFSGEEKRAVERPAALVALGTPGDEEEQAAPRKNTKSVGKKKSLSSRWTELVRRLHQPIVYGIQAVTGYAARYPRRTCLFMAFLAFALAGIGVATNFHVEVDETILFTPFGSQADIDFKWIREESGFDKDPRLMTFLWHSDGENVLGRQQVRQVFQVIDAVRAVPGYASMCSHTGYVNSWGEETCRVESIIDFWNASSTIFEQQVQSDEDAITQMSAWQYPNRYPVAEEVFFGYPERDEDDRLTKAVSYAAFFSFPTDPDLAMKVEADILDVLKEFKELYESDPTLYPLKLEYAAHRSFPDEFTRAILNDIPLVPVVFLMMSLFTCLVFYRRHKVHSRSLLGVSAVVAVMLAITAAFGCCFISNVPFTSITQMLPFIIFGIGLDDAFIVMGAYARTDANLSPEERIRITVDDVGVSITLTTLTSALAFAIGCTSSIPAVIWVCYYAFPSVIMVYIYTLTFFVACIVLDQRRMESSRRDCCTWIVVDQIDDDEQRNIQEQATNETPVRVKEEFWTDRFMVQYSRFLLQPVVKVVVVVGFLVLAVCCAISAMKLEQEFKFKDVLPSDSYITTFMEARTMYSERSHLLTAIYFRNVNQSDLNIQQQMFEFVDQIVSVDAVTGYPDFFWLRDLNRYVDNATLHEKDFDYQIRAFLANEVINDIYGKDIIRDKKTGEILASRVMVDIGNVDVDDVEYQIDTLAEMHRLTNAAPMNQDKGEQSCLTSSLAYSIWEFYARAVGELKFAAVTGVLAVSVISLLLVPHWSAAPIVLPMMCLLYIDILGVMQWGGVAINPVSYVALAMSIGLLVDFIMHVLLKYYELPGTREEKTVEMLRTMGSSIFLGGITTFLGTVPLIFSSSEIFYIVFIGFMGLVTLGVGHGLILLPVVLSTFGTEEQVTTAMSSRVDEKSNVTGSSASNSISSDERPKAGEVGNSSSRDSTDRI